MTLVTYDLEAPAAQGVTITTANSGCTVVNAGLGTITSDTAMAWHGTYGIRITAGSAATTEYDVCRWAPNAPSNTMSIGFGYKNLSAMQTTTNVTFFQVNNTAGAEACRLYVKATTNEIFFQDTNSTNDVLLLSGSTAATKYWISMRLVVATATTGTYTIKIYNSTGTLLNTITAANCNLGTTTITGIDCGFLNQSAAVTGVTNGWDYIQMNDGSAVELLAPSSSSPPTAAFTSVVTGTDVAFNGSASTAVGAGTFSIGTSAPPTGGSINSTVDFRSTVQTMRPTQLGWCNLDDSLLITNSGWKQALKDLGPLVWRTPIAWNSSSGKPAGAAGGSWNGGADITSMIAALKDINGTLCAVIGGGDDGRLAHDNNFTTSDVTNIVTYFNVTRPPGTLPITIAVIGNEFTNSGNNPASPNDYQSQLNARCTAVKAVDGTVLISAPALPDMLYGQSELTTALSSSGGLIDFLSAHAYYGSSGGLSGTSQYETSMNDYRSRAVSAGYSNIWPSIEEFNYVQSISGGAAYNSAGVFDWRNTVFIASVIGHCFMAGANAYGFADTNGYLSLMNDGSHADMPGTAQTGNVTGTKFPAYHALGMWTGMNGTHRACPLNGGHMVSVDYSGLTMTEIFAMDNGKIMIVNKDTASHVLNIALGGVTAGTTNAVWQTTYTAPNGTISALNILGPTQQSNITYSGGILTVTAPAGTVTSVDVGIAALASYAWTFGDATTATTVSPTHKYASAGTYTATLTVTDSLSQTGSVSHPVVVVAPPTSTTYASITTSTGWTPTTSTALSVLTDTSAGAPILTTFLASPNNPAASPLEGVLGPLQAPQSGQPLIFTFYCDRINSTSGSMAAQVFEGATQRSALTGITIPDMTATGGTGTNTAGTISTSAVVQLIFPWTDVVNVVDWNALTLKIQVTAS